MQTAWLIDGEARTGVSPLDRGFAYGDGLFETIAAPGGQPRRLEQHYARLSASCDRLGIRCPSRGVIEADIARLLPAGSDRVIKLIVTRGSGGRGYRPADDMTPLRLVGVFPWPEYPVSRYRSGIRAISCTVPLGENPVLAGMKHLCRLEQVLAQREVAAANAEEGLMRSSSGNVVSGTMSNVFAIRGTRVLTPRLDRCGVAGIMRDAVMTAARGAGLNVSEGEFRPEDFARADELFFCNSVFGIWPVRVLDDIAFDVGKLTQSLMDLVDIRP